VSDVFDVFVDAVDAFDDAFFDDAGAFFAGALAFVAAFLVFFTVAWLGMGPCYDGATTLSSSLPPSALVTQ
jgi:hypothetical protein